MKTNEMKKVLIALDYDPTAQKVAEVGFSLAKAMNCKVILLHVIADATYYSMIEYSWVSGYMGFTDTDAKHLFDGGLKKAMKLYLDKSKHHLGDNSIQTLVKEGDFAIQN